MEKKNLLKFLKTHKRIEEIEEEFGKQEKIYKLLNKLTENEEIRYYEINDVSYYERTSHEFKLTTTRIIAQNAAYICSNPECRVLMIAGSAVLKGKVIKIGEAAHIIGNRATSARYKENPKIDKNSVENGILLCRNCHKLVDSNGGREYPIKLLKRWKKEHIKYLAKNLGKPVFLSSDNLKTAQTFTSWSQNLDIKFPQIFLRDPERDSIIEGIKEIFNENIQSNHIIRLSGLSGLGKTRLIYETIKSSSFKKNTYYYENSSRFLNSDVYTMLKNNIQVNLIIVIDNCKIEDHQKIKEISLSKANRIFIITIGIHNEKHDRDENYFQIEFMNPVIIKKILKINFKKIPNKNIKEILSASHCFPKFAIIFGSNYLKGNIRYIASDYNINRLIFGDTKNLNKGVIKSILVHIALFARLGYSGRVRDEYFETSARIGYPLGNLNDELYKEYLKLESEWVCQLVGSTWIDFTSVVGEFKDKGLIRGKFRIEISSVPLSIFLVNEWWSQNSDPINTIFTIPEKLQFYLVDQFFTFMELYCVLEQDSTSYYHILEFMSILEEKGLYLDKILDFIKYRYKDLKPFDRDKLLQNLIKIEDISIKFLKSILTENLNNLRLRYKIGWITKIINRVSIEIISQTLNEWHIFVSKSQGKIILIDEFQKRIKNLRWSDSILKTLFIYYDLLSDQLKIQFMNRLEKNANYVSLLIATSVNKPSEESMILICISLIKFTGNNTIPLNFLAFIQNYSLVDLRKNILIELSKNEGCIKFLYIFILRNRDIINEEVSQELVKNTNKFITITGKAFQNLLYDILNHIKLEKTILLLKTYEDTSEINQAKKFFYKLHKDLIQTELFIIQQNQPNFKVLSESHKPRKIKYLIISLNISKRDENNFYDFYNIFLKYDFFYYINSVVFPSTEFYETPQQRDFILKEFEMNGFYLIDFNPFRTTYNFVQEDILNLYENSFKSKLEKTISKEIPVIVIDEKLYQDLYENLKKDGFNIIHERPIPKPNKDNYKLFKELFHDALTKASFKPR